MITAITKRGKGIKCNTVSSSRMISLCCIYKIFHCFCKWCGSLFFRFVLNIKAICHIYCICMSYNVNISGVKGRPSSYMTSHEGSLMGTFWWNVLHIHSVNYIYLWIMDSYEIWHWFIAAGCYFKWNPIS